MEVLSANIDSSIDTEVKFMAAASDLADRELVMTISWAKQVPGESCTLSWFCLVLYPPSSRHRYFVYSLNFDLSYFFTYLSVTTRLILTVLWAKRCVPVDIDITGYLCTMRADTVA